MAEKIKLTGRKMVTVHVRDMGVPDYSVNIVPGRALLMEEDRARALLACAPPDSIDAPDGLADIPRKRPEKPDTEIPPKSKKGGKR